MHSGNINNLSYYYFPEALSTLLFSGKISLDNICTEKIVSKSFKFIKKYALKLLLENNNKKFSFHFSPARPGQQRALQRPKTAQRGPAARALGFLPSAAASEPFIISDGCPAISPDQKRQLTSVPRKP